VEEEEERVVREKERERGCVCRRGEVEILSERKR
jgi:hypothetical protein